MIISDSDYKAQSESIARQFYNVYLRKGDVVFDFGAFKGVLALAFAEYGCEVFAIEGSARNYPDLVENTKNYPNIKCILAALHETSLGKVKTRFNDCLGLEHPEQDIDYHSYNDLVKTFNLPTPQFIKMDIEGMESIVLKSMTKVLEVDRPVIQLSVHDTIPHGVTCVYSQFPGFVPVSRGGFDFNSFFKHHYLAFTLSGERVDHIGGFNEYMLIPREKQYRG